ncbi:hypothetical protein ABVT39_026349 [Epinephelus coioides]
MAGKTEMRVVRVSADDNSFDALFNSQLKHNENARNFGILGDLRTQLEFLWVVRYVVDPYHTNTGTDLSLVMKGAPVHVCRDHVFADVLIEVVVTDPLIYYYFLLTDIINLTDEGYLMSPEYNNLSDFTVDDLEELSEIIRQAEAEETKHSAPVLIPSTADVVKRADPVQPSSQTAPEHTKDATHPPVQTLHSSAPGRKRWRTPSSSTSTSTSTSSSSDSSDSDGRRSVSRNSRKTDESKKPKTFIFFKKKVNTQDLCRLHAAMLQT